MTHVERIVKHFLNNNSAKQCGNYVTNGNVLIHIEPNRLEREIVAVKYGNFTVGNSSRLRNAPEIRVKTASGRRTRSTGESEIQAELSKHVSMIPFDVFRQANLNLSKFTLVEKGKSETVKRLEQIVDEKATAKQRKKKENSWLTIYKTIEVEQHFTGASLFQIDGAYFLFDLDRNELNHGILNPFLVKLPGPVKSIVEAYESLKPQEVKDAESKRLHVKRQGEWFFIPVQLSQEFVKEHFQTTKQRSGRETTTMVLQAGPNRPNTAEKGFEAFSKHYVTGKISHSGREHKDLVLTEWHIAIPNTATTSWTITGDID